MNIVPLACARLLIAVFLATGLSALSLANEPEENADATAFASPDNRFVLQKLKAQDSEEEVFGVLERRSRKPVPIEGNTLSPMEDALQAIWSPDSKRLAINARLGGRYETVELFEWTGKKFKQLGDLEKLLTGPLQAEIQRQLKAERLPKDIYLRRIWDTFEVKRWIDNDTLEAKGYTSRTFIRDQPDADPEDITGDFIFTVKIDKKERLKMISKKLAPPEADEETAPEPEASEEQSSESPAAPEKKAKP